MTIGVAPVVLVGVDGSADARRALGWAIAMARVLKAEVLAVYVAGLLEWLHDGPPSTTEQRRDELHERLETVWAAGLAQAGVPARCVVRDGSAAPALLDAIDAADARLAVVGRTGTGVPDALLLGSTSHQLLQAARCPVLVVPPTRAGYGGGGAERLDARPIRRLLVGVDGSPESALALRWATGVARAASAEVLVAHALELAPTVAVAGADEAGSVDYEDVRERAARRLEEQWCATLRADGVQYRSVAVEGGPVLVLLEAADHGAADLIVVGARGTGAAEGIPLGSVSHRVVEHSPLPVVVVR